MGLLLYRTSYHLCRSCCSLYRLGTIGAGFLADIGYNDVDAFLRVLSLVRGNAINDFNSQEISNICWAIGTAGIEARFPETFDTTITSSNGQSSNQNISSDPVTSFFGFAAVDVMKRPQQYNSQDFANLLWGFSTVSVDDVRLE